MTFKEQLLEDINEVFLNMDEFADVHNLNGVTVEAIVQQTVVNDDLTSTDTSMVRYQDGIFAKGAIINVRKSDIPNVPRPNADFRLDGEAGYVVAASDDEGMVTITWAANSL